MSSRASRCALAAGGQVGFSRGNILAKNRWIRARLQHLANLPLDAKRIVCVELAGEANSTKTTRNVSSEHKDVVHKSENKIKINYLTI